MSSTGLQTEKLVVKKSPNGQCAVFECKSWVGVASPTHYFEEWEPRFGIVLLGDNGRPMWGETTEGPPRFLTIDEAAGYAASTSFPGWFDV